MRFTNDVVLLRRRLFAVICFGVGICIISILGKEVGLLSELLIGGVFKAFDSLMLFIFNGSFLLAVDELESMRFGSILTA